MTIKAQSLGRTDNKPLTLEDFLGILRPLVGDPKTWTQIKDKPVRMSCDEEGNGFGKLYAVDISKTGQVTLWPADTQID